jgi:hypothetical protein
MSNFEPPVRRLSTSKYAILGIVVGLALAIITHNYLLWLLCPMIEIGGVAMINYIIDVQYDRRVARSFRADRPKRLDPALQRWIDDMHNDDYQVTADNFSEKKKD